MKTKKFFKKATRVMLAVLMAFGFAMQTDAAQQSLNFTKSNWSSKTSQSLPFSPGEEFHIKYVTGTSTYAYCNDYPFKTPEGVAYTLSQEITDPGKVYILSKAPKTDSGNYLEYYKYQVAYWIYEMDVRGADSSRDISVISLKNQVYNSSSSTAKDIQNIVSTAKKQSKQSALKLSTDTKTLTFTESGNYYVSNTVKVSASDSYKVTVNGPSGTVKEDVSGGFRVKVPVSSVTGKSASVSATVTSSKTMNHAYLYKANSKAPSGRTYQDMAIATSENTSKKVDLSGTIKVTPVTTKVSISKTDATNGSELPGAKLTVTDANGTVVDSWTSTSKPHIIEGLTPGKYTLTEESAPAGYKLSTEKVEFTVKADGTTTKVEMKNEPDKTVTRVEIRKTDATTGEEVPGAKLTIKDASGAVVETWVSTEIPHVVTGLKPGKYTLTEELAPEGYKLSTTTVEFTVKEDGTTTKVEMKNEPVKDAPKTVIISKADATTGEEVPGAKLELRNEKGELVEAWVSGTEPHKIKGLEPGKYYLTETLAPEGYELSTETVEFTVKEDGTVDGKVVMYNKPETIVEVPSTSSFKTITTSLIGLLVIGLGSVVIYRNYKKNEEA